ncbi:hypothetical protein H8B06_07665 [Sphingobacterium sp. DN00404]|uniref:Uncharacterized protein n=1 Tax=Sphingobacterium micropteri TaxID=2763501 RepID=A0ABR7YNA1_9SPHI|nr:hypothetical protein [Sphingobacterium micropteri]MBD1432696.1 hypothetical protein [Sphingobacterium micropteri]
MYVSMTLNRTFLVSASIFCMIRHSHTEYTILGALKRVELGDKLQGIDRVTISASLPLFNLTSKSHRQSMYNYQEMLANANYNDISHPATVLAIGQNVANFAGGEVVLARSLSFLKSAKTGATGAQSSVAFETKLASNLYPRKVITLTLRLPILL